MVALLEEPFVHLQVAGEQVEQFILRQPVARGCQVAQGMRDQRLAVVALILQAVDHVLLDDALDPEFQLFLGRLESEVHRRASSNASLR